MNNKEVKYRHELKYLISAAQIPLLKSRIAAIMRLDPHAGADGKYIIRSLYFDDYKNRCYYENENGTDPREKFRIRIYNHSPAVIHLECKRKERGKTLKTSAGITMEQVNQAIEGERWTGWETLPPLLRKMKLQMDKLPVAKAPMILVVNASDPDAEKRIMDAVAKHTGHSTVKSRNMTGNTLDLIVELRTSAGSELLKDILQEEGVTSASMLSHDGEVTF